MYVIMTTPFSTATPKSAMNPTAALKLKFSPRNHNAATPPISAKGTFSITSAACRAFPKLAYRKPTMISRTPGTMMASRRIARC